MESVVMKEFQDINLNLYLYLFLRFVLVNNSCNLIFSYTRMCFYCTLF